MHVSHLMNSKMGRWKNTTRRQHWIDDNGPVIGVLSLMWTVIGVSLLLTGAWRISSFYLSLAYSFMVPVTSISLLLTGNWRISSCYRSLAFSFKRPVISVSLLLTGHWRISSFYRSLAYFFMWPVTGVFLHMHLFILTCQKLVETQRRKEIVREFFVCDRERQWLVINYQWLMYRILIYIINAILIS